MGNDYYTTGQIARLCQVAPRTAAGWIDEGHLVGERLPGDRTDRRVHRDDLVTFLRGRDYRRALKELGADRRDVVIVGVTHDFGAGLAASFPDNLDLCRAWTVVELGAMAERMRPAAVIVGAGICRGDATATGSWLAKQASRPLLIALIPEDQRTSACEASLREAGYDAWWQDPADPAAVAAWLRKRLQPAPVEVA